MIGSMRNILRERVGEKIRPTRAEILLFGQPPVCWLYYSPIRRLAATRALVRDAENGRISYRETFLGGCAKPGSACPLGGISNITGCMGNNSEKACEWALIDRKKRPVIVKLRGVFQMQLTEAPVGSPLETSLKASIESAGRAINEIDTA